MRRIFAKQIDKMFYFIEFGESQNGTKQGRLNQKDFFKWLSNKFNLYKNLNVTIYKGR